jgi:hypothetical protein
MQIYSYMNNLDKCQGVIRSKAKDAAAKKCNADIWPPKEVQPVKNSWDSWAPQDVKKSDKIWCTWDHDAEALPKDDDYTEIE